MNRQTLADTARALVAAVQGITFLSGGQSVELA